MKNVRHSIILLIAILAMPAATLYAQSVPMLITVPFSFTVADTLMPAGQYVVQGVYSDSVAIQHGNGEAGVILMTHGSNRPLGDTPKLVFHRYGGMYFLAEVQLPGTVSVRTFSTGKEEIEVAKAQKRQTDVEVGR